MSERTGHISGTTCRNEKKVSRFGKLRVSSIRIKKKIIENGPSIVFLERFKIFIKFAYYGVILKTFFDYYANFMRISESSKKLPQSSNLLFKKKDYEK